MRQFKMYTILAFLIIFLANLVNSDNILDDVLYNPTARRAEDMVAGAFSMGLMFLPPPYGAILSIASSTFYELFNMFRDNKNTLSAGNAGSDIELQLLKLSRIETETQKMIAELLNNSEKKELVSNMRNSIRYLNITTTPFNLKCISKKICASEIRNLIIEKMIDPQGDYRIKLSEFVNTYIAPPDIPEIDDLFEKKTGIFDIVIEEHQSKVNKNLYCNHTRSTQTKVFNLSSYLMLMVVKSYTLVTAGHLHHYRKALNNAQKKNAIKAQQWKNSITEVMNSFQNDIISIVKETQNALNKTSRDIQPCDPDEHIRGITFEYLTHFMQAELYRQYDDPQNDGRCTNKYVKSFAERQKDKDIVSCDTNCLVTTIFVEEKNYERQYHHAAFELNIEMLSFKFFQSNQVYGDSYVPKGIDLHRDDFKVDCFIHPCYTDRKDSIYSLRRFSIDRVEATPGYVVTGVRWALYNLTIYLEIQQGLFVNGSVDPTTVDWKETNENDQNTAILDANNRSFSLDDVTLPPGYLVNGVQFCMINGRIIFAIRGLQVDKTGMKLTNNETFAHPNWEDNRVELKLDNADASEFVPRNVQSKILSESGKHIVRFQPTGFIKDAGQTTIPYLDIQKIITKPPSPIGGIGTFYKGTPGYGGFIGLKLLSVNVIHVMDENKFENFFKSLKNQIENGIFSLKSLKLTKLLRHDI